VTIMILDSDDADALFLSSRAIMASINISIECTLPDGIFQVLFQREKATSKNTITLHYITLELFRVA